MAKLDISREKRKKLKKIKKDLFKKEGHIKQEVFNTHFNYVERREGKEGVEKLKKVLKELGVEVDFENIESFEWTREAYSALCIVAAKIVFDWTEDDVFEMGALAPKVSFVFKMFLKYLASPKKAFEKADFYWDKHYDFGTLEPTEFNEKENYAVLRVKDFKFHPLLCTYKAGYIKSIAELAIDSDDLKIKETKCMFNDDPYHEYVISY